MIQQETLPNGIRIVTENIAYVQSVALGMWVSVGARDEDAASLGISHVIEHMLFKGTPTRSAKQIADEFDNIGGDLNAFTSKENTCYHARVLSEHVPLALEILCDMFLNSIFDPEEMKREQNVILEEIKQRDDEPDDLVHDVFTETLWPKHPLGRPIIGTPETVASLTPDALRDYMAKRYTPDTIVIAAAGNLRHEEIVEVIRSHMGHLTGKIDDWRSPDNAPAATVQTAYIEKPIEQVNLVMGTKGYSLLADEKYALSILDNVLGGSMSSRLFQEIREKRGLAYSVGSFAQSFREGGYFAFYAGTGAETAQETMDLIRAECKNILQNNVTPQELERSKNQFRGSIVMGQESMNNRMMRLGRNELSYNRIIPIEEIIEKVNAVNRDEIAAVAHTLFQSGEFALATVGPMRAKKAKKGRAKA